MLMLVLMCMGHLPRPAQCFLSASPTEAAQRKPTEACHRNASRKKKKGKIGSTSTIGAKATNSSGSRACAASGASAPAAPAAAARPAPAPRRDAPLLSDAGCAMKAACKVHMPKHAVATSRSAGSARRCAAMVFEERVSLAAGAEALLIPEEPGAK